MISAFDKTYHALNDDILFIHQLFEKRLNEVKNIDAVCFGEKKISYSELNEQANFLSQFILQNSPDSSIVGISTTRSIETIVGVLAILKSGKAYLPLDPAYPSDRLQQIVTDSGIDCCLSLKKESALFGSFGTSVIHLDEKNKTAAPAEQKLNPTLAYVLYTSGSTGKPKGVCMGHTPLVNLILWQHKNSIAKTGTRTLQFAPLSFDVSFQEIFATLTTGGTLVLIEDDLRLDPQSLLNFIQQENINRIFVPFVALQYLTESADSNKNYPSSLQEVMTAGEQLKITPQVINFFRALPQASLFNQYGPTECHVVTELKLEGEPSSWPALPSIGKAIDNTEILILDEQLNMLPAGEIGELCIAGKCLAEGYLNRPELTAEKFIQWNHPQKGACRIYKTGDHARYLPDGNIEFLGRKDDQVKIRGYRIELGEIEVLLNHQENIQQAVVVAREDVPGQKRLVAYLVSSNGKNDTAALRKSVSEHLPDYMMPSAFVWMDVLPKTSSGKIDKKALPKAEIKRPELSVLYKTPSGKTEKILAALWTSLLQLDKVGANDNFFELGGNSLLALKTVADLKLHHQINLPITKLYQYPTVSEIAQFLSGAKKSEKAVLDKKKSAANHGDVAVIGMAGRFPGAATIDDLWNLLKEGRESVSFFTKEELDAFIPDEIKNDPDYVRARGLIEDADKFDASFFGINPKLAELMDPQQRIFLEVVWEALENGGYLPSAYSGSIGIFAGSGNNSYYLNNVLSNRVLVERMGSFQVMTFNEKDYVASRTAYQLNLNGPAVSVYSACSTSLLAIAEAVENIRNGKCDVAIAGGVAITSPIKSGHIYQDGAMLSRDGHCRSFDADAQGTVFSDGAGAVLLKSREDAERDGDKIYAIIKGVGVNNDGGGKGSFTAPSAEGQAGAIALAIQDSGVSSSDISYVEAHGTATPLGDPIEIEGLSIAFGSQPKKQYCAIGSIKSNMGHLTAASGVAGLIKTVLSLQNKKLLPSINFKSPNPNIDFANSPFFVNDKLRDWETDNKRIAGVSSFGVGGTNVHVVLEEFESAPQQSGNSRNLQLINWSAKTPTSTDAYAKKLSGWLNTNQRANIADVAFSLQTSRQNFNSRRFVIAADRTELVEKLNAPALPAETKQLKENLSDLVFMFPGQGSQYVNMGMDLYKSEPVFRNAVDECAELLKQTLREDIRDTISPKNITAEAEEKINNTYYTQPAMFVIEYATAKLWMSWGLQPMAFVGHSIGEFVAAHLSGVFSLEDALKLIATRGRMMFDLPRGSMLAVRAEYEKISSLLSNDLSLAVINSPGSCVIAGPLDSIADFSRVLAEKNISNRLLSTSHAFHSSMMDPIVKPFEEVVRAMKLSIPKVPIVSTVTGKWMTDENATNPAYWAGHLRSTVRFADAVATLLEEDNKVMLETGPKNVTASLVRQQAAKKSSISIPTLDISEGQPELYSVLKAAGQLWLNGIDLDWNLFYAGQQRIRVNLPAYAFDKNLYWVNPVINSVTNSNAQPTNYLPVNNDPVQTDHSFENKSQNNVMRKDALIEQIKGILENASGIEMEGVTPDMTFIEIGLDSLLLTQIALNLKKEFALPISFRQLTEEYGSLDALATYLDANLPKEKAQPQQPVQYAAAVQQPQAANVPNFASVPANNNSVIGLISQQIQLLAQQIAILQNGTPVAPVNAAPVNAAPVHTVPATNGSVNKAADLKIESAGLSADEVVELKKPFGATARIEKQASKLSEKQQNFLANFTKDYNKKTKGSKEYTQKHRAYMADPRVVSGFRPVTKEIVYPLVVNKSKGARLWDIDGNEYIDALNGFGSNMFGYQPDFITKALKQQIENGYEVGPQHELAGDVCKLICEFTNYDRAGLCNTGSEAVLGAMRIARTVTGRSTIVAFAGSYHGIVDEVIVRGTKKLKSFPAAPGIMPEAVQNMLILDYGTDESLKIIRERAHEFAAVMVETVQSRRPEFQPVEFIKELRKITEQSGAALIFDEVITGFRMHPGGAQAIFGVSADMGTYGKVVGAGISIGIIAGKKKFMDALDGGYWQFGDASTPEAGVTYFAGTFVRHPLALATAKASLEYMKEKGPALQQGLNDKTTRMADRMNAICKKYHLPLFIPHFGSLWKIKFKEEIMYGELLFTLMRYKGIHIQDLFPCFLTEAHTESDIDFIVEKFEESINELIDAEFFPAAKQNGKLNGEHKIQEVPPVHGAKLGKDKDGNPAWFITDPNRPGKYLQVN